MALVLLLASAVGSMAFAQTGNGTESNSIVIVVAPYPAEAASFAASLEAALARELSAAGFTTIGSASSVPADASSVPSSASSVPSSASSVPAGASSVPAGASSVPAGASSV
ncbi:MAG: hypothetical protein JXM71_04780, partial [Spirochaetales bacterium]|nr:hypothetical protein [Spirochaetales bacterium]